MQVYIYMDLFIFLYVCELEWDYVHLVLLGACGGWKRVSNHLGTGVTGSCEPPCE